ncbi:Putative acetyltransferase EpsM [Gimesia panareensis]|uniref:Acetyltransferase EpsM n=1 Tax=Gimesia panareensis TaxID=2527978 RepID=A0A518FM47_9PLAN|nr:acetyltransferase [Gimesia panareensis]QDV17399.1 Putative acetyltransferase EpsM [Gimesia panareensis]
MNQHSEPVILLGGGGHARVLIDLLLESGTCSLSGILDPELAIGSQVKGVPVLGTDKELPALREQGIGHAVVAVGSTRSTQLRRTLFEQVRELGFQQPALVHPSAILSPSVSLAEGVQVMAGAIIQTETRLGAGVVVNTGARIDHDCEIRQHAFLAPGVILSGGVTVGENAFLGAGAVVIQGRHIGANAVVAAGAVVVRDVEDGALVKGVPAK